MFSGLPNALQYLLFAYPYTLMFVVMKCFLLQGGPMMQGGIGINRSGYHTPQRQDISNVFNNIYTHSPMSPITTSTPAKAISTPRFVVPSPSHASNVKPPPSLQDILQSQTELLRLHERTFSRMGEILHRVTRNQESMLTSKN